MTKEELKTKLEASKNMYDISEGAITNVKTFSVNFAYEKPSIAVNHDKTFDVVPICVTTTRYFNTKEEAQQQIPLIAEDVAKEINEAIKKVAKEVKKINSTEEQEKISYDEKNEKRDIEISDIEQTIDLNINIGRGSVTMIGREACANKGLRSVIIGDNISVISRYAFAGNKLTKVQLPKNLGVIGEGAFKDNNLMHITIPERVASIWADAFYNNKLISVLFSKGARLSYIGNQAFAKNNLTQVELPKEVTKIKETSFDPAVTVSQENNRYTIESYTNPHFAGSLKSR